ncbi:pisatin demethylase [Bombardia bombarda]|uniref:Pisatin demethylase n=1 Tax=Bombardia bombarda TaxID=252184 RepID=A0AA39U305_9PEZI|nr:pisatin demethylase [Bombardia bombarda]
MLFVHKCQHKSKLIALSGLILWWIVSSIRQYIRLRHFDGPPTAAFSVLWLLWKTSGPRAHLEYYEACKKYGNITRVGPNELITCELELLRKVNAARGNYTRSAWYKVLKFNPARENIGSQRDGNYSGREIDGLESRIDKHILALVRLIENKYISQNKPFDFARKMTYLTLDALADIGFSQDFGFLATDSDMFGYINAVETTLPFLIPLGIIPWVLSILQLPLVRNIFMPSDTDVFGFGRVVKLTNQITSDRYGPNRVVAPEKQQQQQRDMLDSFVRHGLTEQEASSETLTQIIAGSDTSAGTLRTTMLYILSQARVVERLRREIAAVAPNLSRETVVADAATRDMPYLQSVIKEGLRMVPPISGIQLKQVPLEGDYFNGIHLPGGTKIGLCSWGLMRRADIWGDDAEQFRPERWEKATPEMEGAVDFVFGSGRFRCLGRNIAFIEINKVLVELIRRFDMAVVNPQNPWKARNASLFLVSDFWVRAYPRVDEVSKAQETQV